MDSISSSSDKENAGKMNYAHQQQETGGVKKAISFNCQSVLISRLRQYLRERYPKESWDEEKIFKTVGMSTL